jgi:copper resistance protein C
MDRMSARARARIAGVVAALAVVLALAAPASVLGHAALESADPAPDSTIPEAPELVTADFTERLDPNLSSLTLAAPDGTIIASGGVAAEDPEARQMTLRPPALAPGRYSVAWTAVTPDDGAVEQGSYAFTIALPTPPPAVTPPPTAAPTPAASATPAVTASASATASPAASVAPSASAVASPDASASPAASPEPGTGGSGNGLSPIVIAIVAALVAAVAVAAVYTWRRRGSGGTA